MYSNTSDVPLTTADPDPYAGLSFLEIKRLNYPRWGHTIAGLILLTIGFFGVTENILVIHTFVKAKQLRSATNTFILSLAISDLGMACLGNPLAWFNALHGEWVAGEFMCYWEGFVVYVLGLASLYLLCSVSVDRYIVIAKPLKAALISKRVAVLWCVGCFIGGLFWSIMPFLGWGSYGLEAPGIFCGLHYDDKSLSNMSYIMAIFLFCFFFPMLTMIYSYYGVFMTIKNVNKNSVWDMKSRVARKNLKIEKKMFKSCLIMCGVYWVCWTPYAVVSFWQTFGDPNAVPLVLTVIPAIFAKSQIVWNPIIYVATNKQFRQAFYANLPCSSVRDALVKREAEKEQSTKESKTGGDDGQTDGQVSTIAQAKDANAVAPANNEAPKNDMAKVEC